MSRILQASGETLESLRPGWREPSSEACGLDKSSMQAKERFEKTETAVQDGAEKLDALGWWAMKG